MTTTIKQYDARELQLLVSNDDNIDTINVWLERGDGVAVYENQAFDSSTFGHQQFVSFGSPTAMLEVDEPPVQLPDIGNAINWRYQLRGTYRGAVLEHLPEMDWITPHVMCERIVSSFTNPNGAHVDRVSSWGLEVRRVVNGSGEPTQAQRVEVSIQLLAPAIAVAVQTWLYPEGINALGSFDWFITDHNDASDIPAPHRGSDLNLGSTVVTVHNACLPKE